MPFSRIKDASELRALLEAVLMIEADNDLTNVLSRIVEVSCSLVGARYGALGVLGSDGRTIARFVTHGMSEEQRRAIGELPHGKGLLGETILRGGPVRIAELSEHPEAAGFPDHHPAMHRFLGVPVSTPDGRIYGNLYLTDPLDGEPFSESDEDLITGFGLVAGLVIDKARIRERLRESTLMQERGRLARELHDTVIQRIFGVGLNLQLTLTDDIDARARERIDAALDDLDQTIREIRTTIFEIDRNREAQAGFTERVRELCEEVAERLGVRADVTVALDLDSDVGRTAADQALGALREILSNVVRHAQAHSVAVEAGLEGGMLVLRVRDDGVGFDLATTGHGHGLSNLQERARDHDGEMFIESTPGRGTLVRWLIPARLT